MVQINPDFLEERWGVGEPRSSFAVLHLTSNESIPASLAEEVLSWDAIQSSGGAKVFADIGAHPTTFVIPVGVTYVKFGGVVVIIGGAGTGAAYISLMKNDVATAFSATSHSHSGYYSMAFTTPPIAVVAGDAFSLVAAQSEATAKNVQSDYTWFTIEDVSGDY